MLAISATAAIGNAPRPAEARDPAPAAYASDWRQPTSGPVSAPASAASAATSPADPATVHAHAQLAADVYNDRPSPPDGYRVASDAELQALGLDPKQLDPGTDGFRARVYASDQAGEDFVIAFRGSQSGADWLANAQQGVGLASDHYARALEIGRTIARADVDVAMTGHSLGGGLASAASIAAGTRADTFNAAGLHDDTIAAARASRAGSAGVDNYRVPGEILTALQEGGDRALGAGLGSPLGIGGAIGGAALVDFPEAYGRQHDLPNVAPAGVNWFEGLNVIDRHGMDWVLAGTAARAD